MASVSIKDVARHAAVSTATVSNVLNRPDRVSLATRLRVLDSVKTLGFVRNEAARTLRSGRSRTLGLLVPDVGNPFYTDLARGVESVADDERQIMVMLCNSGEDIERERRHLELLERQQVLGVLITPVGNRELLDELMQRGTRVVVVDRPAGRNCCSVSVDDVQGGRIAVQHLIDQGHQRIAFVGGPVIDQVVDRQRGAQECIHAARIPHELEIIETASLAGADGRQAAEEIAARAPEKRPTAVFCANDLLALGFLQALTQLSIRVPQDIALIGYDDIEFAAGASIPLSSVRQPRELLGQTAARLMLEELDADGKHQHRQVVFEPELVVRETTAFTRKTRTAGRSGRSR